MDFRRLSNALKAPTVPLHPPHTILTNQTTPFNLTDLPANILETLVPGYGVISRYAALYLGVDISIFVTAAIAFLALLKTAQYVWSYLGTAFESYCTSSVYIDEHDDLFDMVMAWLAAHQDSTTRSRKMRAKTQRGSRADESFEETAEDALDENGLFNFSKWSARTPPRFEPYYGRQFVWHGGQIFWFKRSRRPSEGQRVQVTFGSTNDDDVIQLDCIGRSVEPIKDLLKTVRIWSLNRTRHFTTIRHPTPKDRARYGGTWSKTSSRPSRPMDTVILDAAQKDMIIRDMNEYLHPSSPRWYATRGIPYRRGYLFHGPPGTGKTSLSFALAGIFGLEIYAISLQEPTLTEGDLMQLFNGLPRRCIVLLEDIDAAGLIRNLDSDESTKKRPGPNAKATSDKKELANGATDEQVKTSEAKPVAEEYTLKDLAQEIKALGGDRREKNNKTAKSIGTNNTPGTGISLSGLLNAIDGVATHEGRVLIMTTNHPEKLDPALIRPGRVDRKVEFRLAMREQIRELFVRMYAASDMEADSTPKKTVNEKIASNGKISGDKGKYSGTVGDEELANLTRAQLGLLADQFAAHIPDDTFTPAEIQNLLMRHKKEPKTAVANVDSWIKTSLEEKEEQKANTIIDEESEE